MDTKLCARYLAGIIHNKAKVEKSYLPRMLKFDDDRHNLIANAIIRLVDDGSSMSEAVLLDAIKSGFFAVSEGSDWEEECGWFESFVYAGSELEVTPLEIEELYNILQRQRLSDQTKKILNTVASKPEFEEGDIDEALEKLRLIKAVYPSKSAKLDEQSASAVHDALNNSAGIIPYGFKPIDESMGGVCRKEITIIAGRPGHGKTSLVCQFVLNWIQSGHKVLFVSKEMPTSRLLHKFFSNLGNIPSDDIKRGIVEDGEYLESIAGAFVDKYKSNLFLYDNVYSAQEIERLVLKHKPDIVIDDFIQLSDFGKNDIRIGILNTLKHYKSLSKENDCAFVVVSQLSRSIEGRDDPVPRMSDLAESGALEQFAADICFVFYEYKVTYEETLKNRVEFVVAKARYGESTSVPLGFDGKMMRYYAIPKFNTGAQR
jgi:replicative DNA helicase